MICVTSSSPTSRRARRATTHLDATAVTSLSTREASMSSSKYTSKCAFPYILTESPSHPGEPVEDENGYSHLLPASQSLRAVDTCLTRGSPTLVLGAAILCARRCTPCVFHAGASLPSRSRSSRSSSAARPTMAAARARRGHITSHIYIYIYIYIYI